MIDQFSLVPDSVSIVFYLTLLLPITALIVRQQRPKPLTPIEPENQFPGESLIQMAGSVIICLSPDYRILEWNQAATQVYGWSRSKALGSDYLHLLPETIRDEVVVNFRRVLEEKTHHRFEHPVLTHDGDQRLLLWNITPWLDSQNKAIGIIAIGQDITEQQQRAIALVEARDSALDASQAKSQFLAQMSHEIRTPLNAVLGMVELLLRTNLTPQQYDYTRTISGSAKHLLTVINNILDLSKLEAGEMELESLDFDLDNCLGTVLDLMAGKAEEKGLELGILMDKNLPRQIKGDNVRLRQVLINLVNNAIKFTEIGQVVIQATLKSETSQIIKICFTVQDTGIGIAPDLQPKLFKPFAQGSAATTRQYGGTGLGLSICRQFVELMGGEIGVSSTLGEGSTFWFTAEFNKAEGIESSRVPEVLNDLKLLVVDRSPLVRQSVLNLTAAWGIEGDEADSAIAAWTAWQSAISSGKPYDIVLVEEYLLSQNSTAFIQLKRQNSTLAQTKIILMNRMKPCQGAESLLKLADFGSLVKPIAPGRLLHSLLNIVEPSLIQSGETLSPSEQPNGLTTATSSQTNFEPPSVPIRLLLAEDDPINQQVILAQLNLLGYQADFVANGQAALHQLDQKDYDIVLMDCQMPVLDGYETTRLLRNQEGSDQHTIIIALTASALSTDRDKCLAAGMDDYVSKPVELEALAAILRRWTNPTKQKVLISSSNQAVRASTLMNQPPQSLPQNRTLTQFDDLIDFQRLNGLFRGNVNHQHKLLQIFVKQAQTRIHTIRQAIALEDFVSIKQESHSLKGSSANAAVLYMPEVAEQLENLAHQKTLDGVVELVEELQNCLSQVQFFLEKEK